ncbi:MAG: hypothetical protein IJ655_03300 [Lachnospiraceae bacterium]|nr:hypothetical protein [Lachnospiraceae bacterium]
MFFLNKREQDKLNNHNCDDIGFVDIHCHILPGLDDGSQDIETTKNMLDIAYKDGIRNIVFTPHVRRPWLSRPIEDVMEAYKSTKVEVEKNYKDLEVYLGCELYFSHEIIEDYSKLIIPIDDTDYLLVEFSTQAHFSDMTSGLQELVNRGFIPIVAHIERYNCLVSKPDRVRELYNKGIYLQMNADTIAKPADRIIKNFVKYVLDNRFIHFVSTDSHDVIHRRPEISKAYKIVAERSGEKYAREVCSENALNILRGIS